MAEKIARPALYSKWPIPASWDFGVSLDHHPDVPMHLLCLGIVKTIMQRVDKWLTQQRKGTAFSSRMADTLESIEKLSLVWCKLQPYKAGGKFGGWVSEYYLSMARLIPWFYSTLDQIAPHAPAWVEPTHPDIKNWTGDDCKHWLKLRGLPTTGVVAKLRGRVNAYRQLPLDQQPEVVVQFGGPVKTVEDMLESLQRMIACLFTEQIVDDSY